MKFPDIEAETALAACESPIERNLLTALCRSGEIAMVAASTPEKLLAASAERPWMTAVAALQVPVGRYRADMLVAIRAKWGSWLVAVECDGRKFHHGSSEGRLRDIQRDHDFTRHGIRTIRVKGGEIRHGVNGAANRVLRELGLRDKAAVGTADEWTNLAGMVDARVGNETDDVERTPVDLGLTYSEPAWGRAQSKPGAAIRSANLHTSPRGKMAAAGRDE